MPNKRITIGVTDLPSYCIIAANTLQEMDEVERIYPTHEENFKKTKRKELQTCLLLA
jgi:hypothetical protein